MFRYQKQINELKNRLDEIVPCETCRGLFLKSAMQEKKLRIRLYPELIERPIYFCNKDRVGWSVKWDGISGEAHYYLTNVACDKDGKPFKTTK